MKHYFIMYNPNRDDFVYSYGYLENTTLYWTDWQSNLQNLASAPSKIVKAVCEWDDFKTIVPVETILLELLYPLTSNELENLSELYPELYI